MNNHKVILTSPRWHLNGINIVSANLVRGLMEQGIPVKILLTQTDKVEPYVDAEMRLPDDLPFKILKVDTKNGYWESHWQALKDYLVRESPCIYLPNYDCGHSCISPVLPDDVKIIGIVHSDDPWHYEQVSRLGKYWNSIVGVSDTVTESIKELDYSYQNRLYTIPNGITVPELPPIKNYKPNSTIKIVYSGRLSQVQKRILDLTKICDELNHQGIPFELTLIGDGPERNKLEEYRRSLANKNQIRLTGVLTPEEVTAHYKNNDIFILPSEFEGTSISLLEAMSYGCVPLVTDIKSGVQGLIENGVNGFMVPVGAALEFVKHIESLTSDIELRKLMSLNAYEKVKTGGYSVEDMTSSYIDLFKKTIRESEEGRFKRPTGDIAIPPFLQIPPDHHYNILNTLSWKITKPLRWFGELFKK